MVLLSCYSKGETKVTEPLVICIAGPSGSGKTTLARGIYDKWGKDIVAVLSADSYYFDQQHLSMPDREKLNFDAPESIDFALMEQHILELQSGKSIRIPKYDFAGHKRIPGSTKQSPTPIIILEGILILAIERLRKHAKHKIYLDTHLDVCLMRRIRRDCMERGRTVASVLNQYESTVHPMLVKYVLPSRQYATCLFEDGGPIPGVFSWVNESIQTHINSLA